MSVVGPRPCVKYELGDFETLNKRYKKRFQVKAGLTGLAQIKGRNDITCSCFKAGAIMRILSDGSSPHECYWNRECIDCSN